MHSRFRLPLSTGVVLLALALPAQDRAASAAASTRKPLQAPLAADHAALNAQSIWAQDARYEGAKPDKSKRGVYPVGNGRVFTYIGLGERANTMLALSGPTYAAPEKDLPRGNFGELTLTLRGAELPVQKVRRVTDANFVVTEDSREDGLALRTLTFAEPGTTTITRVIDVVNGGKQAASGLVLVATLAGGEATPAGSTLVKKYQHGTHAARAVFAMTGASASAEGLAAPVGELAPGASFRAVLTVGTAMGEGGEAAPVDVASATAAAGRTLAFWAKKIEPMPRLRTDHDEIMDLFKDWKVLMLTMRDERSGVVTPMVDRRGAWVRESTGPLLTFLRYNMWDEAKALLDYFYNAIRLTGEVREYYPLELDFASLEGKETDWKSIQFPDTDLGLWLLIHHFWYYRSTYDAKLIEQRQDFLRECLAKQKRGKQSLMSFSGHENYMRVASRLPLEQFERNPLFVAEAPEHGRRSRSLASTVLFLTAIHGYGEMLDGVDRLHNPEKWAGDTNEIDKPSKKWLERSFGVLTDLEDAFWTDLTGFPVRDDLDGHLKHGDDWRGIFAPAISPVTGEPHREPVANINLFPLWIGFTYPTGERSRHNLRNTLGRLWHRKDANGKRDSALVGTTATVPHFTGDVPGMLLYALVERNGKDRVMLFREMLEIAAPAGEWGLLYGPDRRPMAIGDPEWPQRMSPNECGINLDALMFALNGVRHVNVPNFDNQSIKVKLRLPEGATFLEMDNLRKDGRAFNVHVDEYFAPLSEDEKKRNDAQQDPKYKRDPTVDHRRFRFRMELVSDNPPQGRHQVDADVSGTMFVRYLYKGAVGGVSGEINESEFWREDQEVFFLDDNPSVPSGELTLPLKKGADLLVLTNRPQCAEIVWDPLESTCRHASLSIL